jgi:hypothetical protein
MVFRYRALDANGDSTFGSGRTAFFVDNVAAVAQSIQTRMVLYTPEWFLDSTEGLDLSKIAGRGTTSTYDAEIQNHILGTKGVTSIDAYSSNLDRPTRKLSVSVDCSTIFGPTGTITFALNVGQ